MGRTGEVLHVGRVEEKASATRRASSRVESGPDLGAAGDAADVDGSAMRESAGSECWVPVPGLVPDQPRRGPCQAGGDGLFLNGDGFRSLPSRAARTRGSRPRSVKRTPLLSAFRWFLLRRVLPAELLRWFPSASTAGLSTMFSVMFSVVTTVSASAFSSAGVAVFSVNFSSIR